MDTQWTMVRQVDGRTFLLLQSFGYIADAADASRVNQLLDWIRGGGKRRLRAQSITLSTLINGIRSASLATISLAPNRVVCSDYCLFGQWTLRVARRRDSDGRQGKYSTVTASEAVVWDSKWQANVIDAILFLATWWRALHQPATQSAGSDITF